MPIMRKKTAPPADTPPAAGTRGEAEATAAATQGLHLRREALAIRVAGYLAQSAARSRNEALVERINARLPDVAIRYERDVRAAKREEVVALTPEAKAAAHSDVLAAQARIREHVDSTNAVRQRAREQITKAAGRSI